VGPGGFRRQGLFFLPPLIHLLCYASKTHLNGANQPRFHPRILPRTLKYREEHSRTARLLDPDVLDHLAELAVEDVESLDEFYQQALIDCMARLTLADRELIRQRYFEATTVQAMAAAMNRSPSAVSKSLCRVRRLLLDCINSAGQRQSDRERMS
jgi:DNA-directed RNA polymerase specialized sigma24 family protein